MIKLKYEQAKKITIELYFTYVLLHKFTYNLIFLILNYLYYQNLTKF
jgi:hypothetical protein